MTLEEIDRLKARVAAAEQVIADILTVLNKTVTAASISRLVGHTEEEIADHEARIVVLEAQMLEMMNDPYNEQQD